jgi:nitronate monooxygenase
MLSTPWSRDLGLRVPIVNAPMGGVAGGRLAAAVTAAGGLGMVGMGSDGSRESLKTQLRHVRGTFGIGLVDWVLRSEAGLLEDALAAGPVLLSVSFGADWSWVAKAHEAGIATVTQVYDHLGARQAVDAGVGVRVARGAGGGGPGEVKLATLPLLDTVLDALDGTAVPVANDFVGRWTGREDALDRPACDELTAATAADDRRIAPVDAGQGVGMISKEAPVGEVIEQMCAGAESLLRRWGS